MTGFRVFIKKRRIGNSLGARYSYDMRCKVVVAGYGARGVDEAENRLMRLRETRRRYCAAALTVGLMALAGCDATGPFARDDSPGAVESGNPEQEDEQSMAALRPGVPPALPQDESLAARAVVGGSEAEVTSLLGEPSGVRNEPPAMVWHYTGPHCRLDIFFYFDIRNKDFRALSYKFYPNLTSRERERACLSSIRKAASR